MDAERDGAIPLAELADIVRSLQQTIDQIARAVDDRSGRGRPPWILKKLSTLKAIRFDSGRAALVIEAPHDVENLHIDFREADACVQALQLFVDSLDALSRGEDPPVEIGEPASKSLRFFVNVLGGYDRVWIKSEIGDTATEASFVPYLLSRDVEQSASVPDAGASKEIVGMLYGANLRTRTVRIEDWLAKTHILRLADDLDEWAIGSLLSETVRVEVAVSDMEHGGSAQLVVTAIERVEPPETSDYYTWDFEAAVERAKPIESIHDLAIPGIDEDEADAFWRAVND